MEADKKIAIAGACAMIATFAFAFEIDLRTARIEAIPSCTTNESQKQAVRQVQYLCLKIIVGRNSVNKRLYFFPV